MHPTKKTLKQRQSKLFRSLVATAFIANGIFPFTAPAFAEGTAAGTNISNTATATYEDPNSGTPLTSTSNTVTVRVAEVAGVTVTASGVINSSNPGQPVQVGNTLFYTYTITNVGNDPTTFRIPNLATTTGPGSVSGNLEYSTNGGTTWIPITTADAFTPSIIPNGTVLVRVPVTVASGAQSNDIITVTLGNTPANAQNVLRNPDGGDVYTVDNPDNFGNGEVAGEPINGTREASATQQATVGQTSKTYALATILKVRTNYDNVGTAAITDDKLTYSLSLRVEGNDVTGKGITPAPLVGTTINVDGANGTYILVSDAIPLNTKLAVVPTPPPGWDAVYTIAPDDPNTNNANATTQWKRFSTTPVADNQLVNVKRVGFINKATISSIAPGQTVSGFSVQIQVLNTFVGSSLTVANIAQLFGQTPNTNTLVFDESGDANPANYSGLPGNMTPPGIDANNDGIPDNPPITTGYTNNPSGLPNTSTDVSNNNTGSTNNSTGDFNVYTIQPPQAVSILNGPLNAPAATGPDGTTATDFTNKSSIVPAGTVPGSTLDPQAVGFTNTVQNSGTNTGTITLVPTPPATAGDLPNGTKVTITYGSASAVYTYNSGTNSFTFVSSSPIANTPISIPNIAGGASVNYGVEVDLPAGTPLSTDIDKGFPVPITATLNDGNSSVSNITIDRVYTGFLKMVKYSRILQGTGPAVGTGQGDFETTPSVTNPAQSVGTQPPVTRTPQPRNIIEYQIRYKNISEVQSGTGNVILNADKVVITEDGVTLPNNWARDNDGNSQIDTSNVVGSAKDSGSANITFFKGDPANTSGADETGTTVNTDVTKYVNTVNGQVGPQVQRTFTFQRKLN